MFRKIVLGLAFWILFPGQLCAANLMMVVNTWPPYVEQSMPEHGLAVQIVTEALQRKGHRVSVQYETWPRALEGLDLGIFDMVGTIWFTPERAQSMVFSKPYLTNKIKFLKRKSDDIPFATLEDLTGYFIGIVRDYAYEEEFVNSRRHIKIPQNHIVQNLQLLVQGDIDMTLGDERAINYAIEKYMPNKKKDLDYLAKPLSVRGLRIAISKQNPNAEQVVADFDQAIEEMKADGSYQSYVHQFGD